MSVQIGAPNSMGVQLALEREQINNGTFCTGVERVSEATSFRKNFN